MIVGKVNNTLVSADEAYATWKLSIGSPAKVCSTEGCSLQPTTALQVKLYGSKDIYIAPICEHCAQSKAILTDLKEDTELVLLEDEVAAIA